MPMIWLVKKSAPIKEVLEKLKEHPEYWFITIVDKEKDDGKLVTVLNEKLLWRYIGIKNKE